MAKENESDATLNEIKAKLCTGLDSELLGLENASEASRARASTSYITAIINFADVLRETDNKDYQELGQYLIAFGQDYIKHIGTE